MKAAVFKGAGRPLVVESCPDPKPGTGEVIIRVGRCGICSSDLHMTSGHGFTYPAGTILGHEYAGEIVEVGPGVEDLKVGDRITAMPMAGCGACPECFRGFPLGCSAMRSLMSGYAEYARAAESSAVKLPRSLSVADGALIEPLASSLRGVAMSGIRPGSRVLVLGVGPIGMGAIYWAKLLGASDVVAVAKSERQKDLAVHIGATRFLTQGEDLTQRVVAALGGLPEIVFECVGAPGSLGAAADLVAPRGTVVVLGMCMSADSVNPFSAGFKSMVMKFSAAYELRDFEAAARAIDRGSVEPRAMITDTIPLEALPATFERLREKPVGCKILVNPGAGMTAGAA
jgi:threonine dehydrogenase-like Zn-dependent dehydrogenase